MCSDVPEIFKYPESCAGDIISVKSFRRKHPLVPLIQCVPVLYQVLCRLEVVITYIGPVSDFVGSHEKAQVIGVIVFGFNIIENIELPVATYFTIFNGCIKTIIGGSAPYFTVTGCSVKCIRILLVI